MCASEPAEDLPMTSGGSMGRGAMERGGMGCIMSAVWYGGNCGRWPRWEGEVGDMDCGDIIPRPWGKSPGGAIPRYLGPIPGPGPGYMWRWT